MTNIAGTESPSQSPASPSSALPVSNAQVADSADNQITPKDSTRDAGAASPDTYSAEELPDVAGMTLVSSTVHTQQDESTPTYPARPTDVPEHVSPEVESLKAMFPDFDIIIL
ncbi:hypothetical protein EW145_g7126 [Phellinidium pouzarii]|uniref:Uncharacterized protein n=1 Tax=Phellinidium pouzarii TaxID=167371 RepID=A0A4S4KQN0_9AGAM|nr:hypothetical protein EW145_g7126 [Phellinidium pouzarii]